MSENSIKYIVYSILLVLMVVFAASNIRAQSPSPSLSPSPSPSSSPMPNASDDFNKSMQDYVFTYTQYQTAHDDYDLAKGQYATSQTLSAKAKAVTATAAMLQARDEAAKSYMTMLRRRLAAAIGVADNDRNLLNTKIDIEVAWFDDHKKAVPTAGSLQDLTADSNLAKTHYTDTTVPIIYDILTKVAVGKIVDLRTRQSDVISRVTDVENEIRADNDPKAQTIERWILDTKNSFTRSQEKETDALAIKLEKRTEPASYDQRQSKLREALQYLKEANTSLKEIIKTIVTQ